MSADTLSPRTRVGVGPTLRVSKDADEVIMGTGSVKVRVDSARHTAPRRLRSNHVGVSGSVHPPRTSSLPISPESVDEGSKAPGPSVGMYFLSQVFLQS
jgi:hypothetical protein